MQPGEGLFMDISHVEVESYSKSKYWLLVVNNTTNYCWSFYLKAKSETSEKMIELIKEVQDKHKITVKKI